MSRSKVGSLSRIEPRRSTHKVRGYEMLPLRSGPDAMKATETAGRGVRRAG